MFGGDTMKAKEFWILSPYEIETEIGYMPDVSFHSTEPVADYDYEKIHVREITEPNEIESLRKQVLDFQAQWIECAESHTDIEMELRDLKIHHAKVREQTIREVLKFMMGEMPDKENAALLSRWIESKFLPKCEENK